MMRVFETLWPGADVWWRKQPAEVPYGGVDGAAPAGGYPPHTLWISMLYLDGDGGLPGLDHWLDAEEAAHAAVGSHRVGYTLSVTTGGTPPPQGCTKPWGVGADWRPAEGTDCYRARPPGGGLVGDDADRDPRSGRGDVRQAVHRHGRRLRVGPQAGRGLGQVLRPPRDRLGPGRRGRGLPPHHALTAPPLGRNAAFDRDGDTGTMAVLGRTSDGASNGPCCGAGHRGGTARAYRLARSALSFTRLGGWKYIMCPASYRAT